MTNPSSDTASSDIDRIEIRPEVTVLSVLRHLNYKAWFALAEFIDNSLQSFLANRERLIAIHGPDFKLEVDVVIETAGPGRIVITDNAAGISQEDFPRAFKAAQVPEDRTGLSEFGMGMKSAACWFAQAWSVRTKALDERIERTITFDIGHIVQHRIESLEPEPRPASAQSHYTVVTLRGLHHIPQGRTLGKICEHLASIYRVFLREGTMSLTVNGKKLQYVTPEVLNALPFVSPGVADHTAQPVRWGKDINFDFGDGQRVHGFAALREVGSTHFAGFALFRRKRLIQGSHDETYRPPQIFRQSNSYTYQRLFGELHIEGFDVSHTKDGFRWEEHEDIFLECLKEELSKAPLDLLSQAENYRVHPTRKSIEAKAGAATQAVASHLKSTVEPLLSEARSILVSAHTQSPPTDLRENELKASEHSVTVNDGSYSWLITLRTSIDPRIEDWVSIAKEELPATEDFQVRRLGIDLSLVHPFSTEFLGAHNENIELLLRIATATCIALVLSEDMSSIPPEAVLFHLNYLLRGALLHAPLVEKAEA